MRPLLTWSLSGVLLIAMLASASALLTLERLRAGEAALRNRIVERNGWLEEIRTGIYLSGTLARDYFSGPAGPDASQLQARLTELERKTRLSLARYLTSKSTDNRDAAQLRAEVLAYWKVLDLMMEMSSQPRTPALDTYFRHQLAQRRETMLRITSEIGMAMDREIEKGATQLSEMYGGLRRTLLAGLAIAIGFGVILSIATIRRMSRLEDQSRALSAQLVDSQEQERRAIARELHDDIGQALSGLRLEIGHTAAVAQSIAVQTCLHRAAATTEEIIDSVRQMALSLRPSMLDDLGLVPALEWQAREVEQRTGLNVEVSAEDIAGELPDSHRTCIYRVAQEALRNCARHASARRVKVALNKASHSVSLLVEDDGRGFSVTRARGLGLLGMEERVGQLGGRLRVRSEPGRGTTLTAELPI